MSATKTIAEVVQLLNDLSEEESIPKNIKLKIQHIISDLDEESDISIKINKALNELDEITEDTNIQQYVRTQIWNIVSLLEKIV